MNLERYEDYRAVNLGWTQQLPREWNLVRLKHLVELQKRPPGPEDRIVTCFRDGTVTLRANRRDDGFTFAEQEAGYQGVRTGDLVIHAMDAFAGAIGVSDSDGKSSPVYSVCTPRRTHVDVRYIAYSLRVMAKTGFITSLAKGIRERSTDFRWSQAGEVVLPMPPHDEQRRIAAFLDHETRRIDELVKEQRQLIDLMKERWSAVLKASVSGQVRIHKRRAGGFAMHPHDAHVADDLANATSRPRSWHSVALRRLVSMRSGDAITSSDITDSGTFPVYGGNGIRGFTDRQNDRGVAILIGRQGALCGNVHLVRGDRWVSEHAVIARPTTELVVEWLRALLEDLDLRQYSQSAAQPGLAVERVKSLRVPVPPRTEQATIAAFLQEEAGRLDAQKGATDKLIRILDERRSALITAAVTGQIDVGDWRPTDEPVIEVEREALP